MLGDKKWRGCNETLVVLAV